MKYKTIQFTQICFLFLIIAMMVIVGCNNKNQNNDGTNNGGIPFNADNIKPHIMSSREAVSYIDSFKASRKVLNDLLSNNAYFAKRPFTLLNGEYFNRDVFLALLNKKGAAGIRIYLGQDPSGKIKLILVPATEKTDINERILALKPIHFPGISSAQAAPFQDGEVLERGLECPLLCPTGSVFSEN